MTDEKLIKDVNKITQYAATPPDRLRVLCITDFYTPGYKAGGPIRSLANLVNAIDESITFSIITRNRDLGEQAPYGNVQTNKWQKVGKTLVYYAEPKSFGIDAVAQYIDEFDVLYLNSFFSFRGSISLYLKYRDSIRIVIAPRGDFSIGAMAFKRAKKELFVRVMRWLGLYRDVEWHASTSMEARDIERIFPSAKGRIHLAADPVVIAENTNCRVGVKVPGEITLGFISRIAPVKNLSYLIDLLKYVTAKVTLNIFGPIEDGHYWDLCRNLIKVLPANITVNYMGALLPKDVPQAFAAMDLFALPTKGENFGHVIFEALAVGTPVIVSDRTPWTTDDAGALMTVPLETPSYWREHIQTAADYNHIQQSALRDAAKGVAAKYAESSHKRRDHMKMFLEPLL